MALSFYQNTLQICGTVKAMLYRSISSAILSVWCHHRLLYPHIHKNLAFVARFLDCQKCKRDFDTAGLIQQYNCLQAISPSILWLLQEVYRVTRVFRSLWGKARTAWVDCLQTSCRVLYQAFRNLLSPADKLLCFRFWPQPESMDLTWSQIDWQSGLCGGF